MMRGFIRLDGKCKKLHTIDLCSGHRQCRIADKNTQKTTFLTIYSLYKWLIMPTGLTNVPAIFIQTMNKLFFKILDSRITVFLDDILVYSHMVKEHFMLLEKVLACLHQYTFYYKLKKCSFLHNSTMFLDFDTAPEGMSISDSQVHSLNKWPTPRIVH